MSSNNNSFTSLAAQELEAQRWDRIADVLENTCFPIDEGIVDQSLVAKGIQEICADFGHPEATPYLQSIILLEWRERFLDGDTEMFQNARGEVTFVDLDDELTPVCGMAYEWCAALQGDAVVLHQIDDTSAPALAPMLAVMHAEGGLPQGDSDYGEMAQRVRVMLDKVIKAGSLGDGKPVNRWTPLVQHQACNFDDLENLLLDAAASILIGALNG